MPTESLDHTARFEHTARSEGTQFVEEAAWQRPEYTVVETALEVTAYSLATR
ncbi:hypothetical protein GCM10020367_52650 [Streptomyces sannanensis]|uniref:Coenzyme PQQ synthesis protein A n=1 Tax=Streptomyces sannanensis TaxID=285536 RepID=A0ABP6SIP6_9ACTN